MKKIVIKIGTSTLTHAESGELNLRWIQILSRTVADLQNTGNQVVIVTSGAVCVGLTNLNVYDFAGFKSRTRGQNLRQPAQNAKIDFSTTQKQAAAAIGQVELMNIYRDTFAGYNKLIAQILLTRTALEAELSARHAKNTMNLLLENGIIPIINANDSVDSNEIEFGDNDTLSAQVASLIDADLLVILTDTEGLYNADPHKNPHVMLIPHVSKITSEIKQLASAMPGDAGKGGMATKILAAEIAISNGFDMIIASGKTPEILYQIMEGEQVGTYFGKKRL
ncbi:MAG: glutamate 5-kinase [Clostridiales bacterium]|jgi:glutamate 5-kinase|nr:glutamate 5-kinase [Clostridiales bacterium]